MLSLLKRHLEDLEAAGQAGWPGTKVDDTLPLPMLRRPCPSLAPVKLLNSAVQEHTDPQASLPGAGLTQPLWLLFCVSKSKSQHLSGLQWHLCQSGVKG